MEVRTNLGRRILMVGVLDRHPLYDVTELTGKICRVYRNIAK
jgi:hypothetical protein